MFDLSFIYDLIAQVLPWEWAQARFMQQALVGLLILSPMCAAMGVQVVNLRMAFFFGCHQSFCLYWYCSGVTFEPG